MISYVFEAILDVVFVVDRQGRITMANNAAEVATGYSHAELERLSITQLLADEDSGIRSEVRRRVEGGDPLRREAAELITKSGVRVPVSVTGAAIMDPGGLPTGIVLVLRDTTEMTRLLDERDAAVLELREALASIEQRLDQSRTQLVIAERHATLGTLAGGVGHELETLARLHTRAVETIAKTGAAPEAIAVLAQVGEQIESHARRLIQLARPGPDHARPLDLNRVVEEVVAMLRGAGKLRGVEVELALDSQPLLVTINQTRIEQIIVNLVVNAIDATPESGKIMLAVQRDETRHRAVVEVIDSGTGIPPDVLPRIFDSFFTTKGERGTGLGLPVVREIVESYGGTIVVKTTIGIGSAFTFDLPMSASR